MTTSTQNDFQAIEETMFDTPSGDVRGIITAFIPTKKGRMRIAHTVLLTDKDAQISVSLPRTTTPDELERAMDTLRDYVARVRVLDVKP